MDSKKNPTKEVELVLRNLHQQIDSLREKVDKLCETTGCFRILKKSPKKNESKK
jgi:hypothetical protein|tara:strand:- start:383 stop:544 length:162 start_codon:yes stop_codon:yes gene_type:complete